jgi:hypothetical protein
LEGVQVLGEIWILGLRWRLGFLEAGRGNRRGRSSFGDDTMNKWAGAHSLVFHLLVGGGENLAQWLLRG